MANYIRYANQGATRNQALSEDLLKRLAYLEQMGLTAEVFSGGQPAKGSGLARVGSTRHDHGNAADVFFYKGDKKLDWANPEDRPIFEQIVSEGRKNGLSGIGAGDGYMQPGSMHIGLGSEGVWGKGGSSKTAPGWLKDAFYGTSGSSDPVSSTMIAEVPEKKPLPSFGALMASKASADTTPVTVTTTTVEKSKSHNGPLVQAFNKITGKNVQVPSTIGGVGTDKVMGAFSGLGGLAQAMAEQDNQLNSQIQANAARSRVASPIEISLMSTEVPGLNRRKRRGGLGGIGGFLL